MAQTELTSSLQCHFLTFTSFYNFCQGQTPLSPPCGRPWNDTVQSCLWQQWTVQFCSLQHFYHIWNRRLYVYVDPQAATNNTICRQILSAKNPLRKYGYTNNKWLACYLNQRECTMSSAASSVPVQCLFPLLACGKQQGSSLSVECLNRICFIHDSFKIVLASCEMWLLLKVNHSCDFKTSRDYRWK